MSWWIVHRHDRRHHRFEYMFSSRVKFSNWQWMKANNTKTAPYARCASNYSVSFLFSSSFYLSFTSFSPYFTLLFTARKHNQHRLSFFFLLFSVPPPCQWPPFVSIQHARALLSSSSVSSYFTLTHIGAPSESTIHFFNFLFFFLSFAAASECFSPRCPCYRHRTVSTFYLLRETHRAHTINRQNIQIITTTSASGAIGTKWNEWRGKKREWLERVYCRWWIHTYYNKTKGRQAGSQRASVRHRRFNTTSGKRQKYKCCTDT